MIQFNKTQAKIESKIKPEFQSKIKGAIFEHYMARIAMINGATVHAAIVGYKGLSWRSGKSTTFSSYIRSFDRINAFF